MTNEPYSAEAEQLGYSREHWKRLNRIYRKAILYTRRRAEDFTLESWD